jgi:hypothetical protein
MEQMKYLIGILSFIISVTVASSQEIYITFDSLNYHGYDGGYPVAYDFFVDEFIIDIDSQVLISYVYYVRSDGYKLYYVNQCEFIPFEDRFGGDVIGLNAQIYIDKNGEFVFDYVLENPYYNHLIIPHKEFNDEIKNSYKTLELYYDWSSPFYKIKVYE